MILLTGAAGKTGKSILTSLVDKNMKVRAFVRSQKQSEEIKTFGLDEIFIGDLNNPADLAKALSGVEIIYYICPNISPNEFQISQTLVSCARKHAIKRFIYHSVLHPQIESMPHHWQKMRTEELLFSSGFDFTILQPCAYMQNILSGWKTIAEEGKYKVPYSGSTRISIVDLFDVGEAASNVITQSSHSNAIYELAGPDPLSQIEVAFHLGEVLERQILFEMHDRNLWTKYAQSIQMDPYQVSVLLKMFEYYDKYGLVGNPFVLKNILGRQPTSFKEFLVRHLSCGGNN